MLLKNILCSSSIPMMATKTMNTYVIQNHGLSTEFKRANYFYSILFPSCTQIGVCSVVREPDPSRGAGEEPCGWEIPGKGVSAHFVTQPALIWELPPDSWAMWTICPLPPSYSWHPTAPAKILPPLKQFAPSVSFISRQNRMGYKQTISISKYMTQRLLHWQI